MNNLLSNITVQQLREAIAIREQIEALERRLADVLGQPTEAKGRRAGGRGRRIMSAAARARIAASQRARWARLRGSSVTNAAAPKQKRRLSSSGRAAIIAATKARWARWRATHKG